MINVNFLVKKKIKRNFKDLSAVDKSSFDNLLPVVTNTCIFFFSFIGKDSIESLMGYNEIINL